MNHKILITGGTGLVGSRLTEMLLNKGFEVSHIGRTKKAGRVPSFVWDIKQKKFDAQALKGVNTVVHLAGAGVADKRWTTARKKEILGSRIESTKLLFETLKTTSNEVNTVVAASAIGYYGFGMGEETVEEDSKPGTDFLAQVTKQWEAQVDKIGTLGIRMVKLRIGIVLSEKGGALAEMAKPIKLGAGAALGSGKQYLSWIHLDDLCEMFIKAIAAENMNGAYNAVGTGWVTNQEMTKAIAHILKKPLLLPSVPGFVLKIILGEMADMVLNGSKVSSKKIQKTGFSFQYTSLDDALKNLLQKN
jgi:uncharacterized protein (TIGR01777 family)